MTYDELLAEIKDDIDLYTDNCFSKALLAVVQLHKSAGNTYPGACKHCDDLIGDDENGSSEYPCPTIEAIQKELA